MGAGKNRRDRVFLPILDSLRNICLLAEEISPRLIVIKVNEEPPQANTVATEYWLGGRRRTNETSEGVSRLIHKIDIDPVFESH